MSDRNELNGARGMKDKVPRDNLSRKDFMGTVGVCACLGGLSLAVTGALRSAVPGVLPDPSARFKIGTAGDFVPGQIKNFKEENVVLIRDDEGLYAISTLCTHLGCVVNRNEDGFQCPCHGSRYDHDGNVIRGPAPKSLPWFQIERLPGGQLSVDRNSEIPIGTKLKLDTEEEV